MFNVIIILLYHTLAKETKQHTITMSMKLPLVNDGISYKKGKSNQFLKDRKEFKKYDILEGESQLTTPLLCLNSLNGNRLRKVSRLIYFTTSKLS